MPPDPSSPAENHDHAYQGHPAQERPDPPTFASEIFAHLDFVHGTDADVYLARVVAELFELSPIAREHVLDFLIADLTEELHRHGDPGREAAQMVAEIQRAWTQGP